MSALPHCHNACVIARRQLAGKGEIQIFKQNTILEGRAGNEWISPAGAAMWSFNYCMPASCKMAKSVE